MNLYLKTKDYSVSNEAFELFYDADMDMLITRPEPNDLGRYYESENYISHTDAKKTLLDQAYQLAKKISLKRKEKLIARFADAQKSLLDVGAGTGDFLLYAKSKGWEVKGVEPNMGARTRALEKAVELLPDLESLKGQKFQLITLWHVLEHLPDLDEQVKTLLSLLETDGTLVVAVPNYRSYDAIYYKEFWAAYDVPRHLWHFSRTSIKKLILKHGMRVVDTRPMVLDSFYVSILSEKYRKGSTNFLNAFWIGLRSNLKALRTKEYSSLIYILKKDQNSF